MDCAADGGQAWPPGLVLAGWSAIAALSGFGQTFFLLAALRSEGLLHQFNSLFHPLTVGREDREVFVHTVAGRPRRRKLHSMAAAIG